MPRIKQGRHLVNIQCAGHMYCLITANSLGARARLRDQAQRVHDGVRTLSVP